MVSATEASGHPSQSVHDMASVRLRVPTVLTPSQCVNRLAGKLPGKALSEMYAGRHEHVEPDLLEETTYFLKYAYAVYSLTPSIESPSSFLDIMTCWRPPAPQDIVFSGFNELEKLEDDSAIELLHLNCSNRMLAHLPYLIALDHARKTVVLAVRGTISAADIVTDAIVTSERVEDLVPERLGQQIDGPCFAHAGMVAAAGAIFADMKERGILAPLVGSGRKAAEVGVNTAPSPQERMSRDGRSSMYEADTGPGPGGGPLQKLSDVMAAPFRAAAQMAGGVGAEHGGNIDMPRESAARTISTGGRRKERMAEEAEDATTSDIESQRVEPMPRVTIERPNSSTQEEEEEGAEESSPARRVGQLMRKKLVDEGWQMLVVGHSLGAGAAALISLQLLDSIPGLRCFSYSCPGALVSRNLAHAMANFTTTIVVGKDAVPRASVTNLGRLMDEMVTSLARCRQPKLKVSRLGR